MNIDLKIDWWFLHFFLIIIGQIFLYIFKFVWFHHISINPTYMAVVNNGGLVALAEHMGCRKTTLSQPWMRDDKSTAILFNRFDHFFFFLINIPKHHWHSISLYAAIYPASHTHHMHTYMRTNICILTLGAWLFLLDTDKNTAAAAFAGHQRTKQKHWTGSVEISEARIAGYYFAVRGNKSTP